MLSPSLPLGSISGLWGNRLLQYIEANTQSLDFHVFFQFWYHSIPSSLNFCQPPIRLFLVLCDHPLPAATPWHSIQLLRLFFLFHCKCLNSELAAQTALYLSQTDTRCSNRRSLAHRTLSKER